MTTKISWKFCVLGLHVYLLLGFELPLAFINVDKILCNLIFTLRRQSTVKKQWYRFTHIISSAYFAGNMTFIRSFYIVSTFLALKSDYALLNMRTVPTIAQRRLL